MSKNTDLIIKIISTTAAIQDSDDLARYGIISSSNWTDTDLTVALLTLDNLIEAANEKKKQLIKTQYERVKNRKADEAEFTRRKREKV